MSVRVKKNEEAIALNSVPNFHPRKAPFTNRRDSLDTLSQHSDSRRCIEAPLPEDCGVPFVKAAIHRKHTHYQKMEKSKHGKEREGVKPNSDGKMLTLVGSPGSSPCGEDS